MYGWIEKGIQLWYDIVLNGFADGQKAVKSGYKGEFAGNVRKMMDLGKEDRFLIPTYFRY